MVLPSEDKTCDTTHLQISFEMSEETSESSDSVRETPPVFNLSIQKNTIRSVLRGLCLGQSNNTSMITVRANRTESNFSGSDSEEDQNASEKYIFSGEWDLLVNCIGFSVGTGNLWRFPYVAFKNGGGAFLIPYLILTILITLPLYYMELILGQCSGLDPLTVWSLCPFFKGLGITILLCTFVVQVYYTVIMSYALFYVFQTFRQSLPWSRCFEWWGADANCYDVKDGKVFCKSYLSMMYPANCSNTSESSSYQFWKKYVLDLSTGLDDLGTVKWDLALVLLASWLLICCLVLGRHHYNVRVKIKTVYFTAFFPFVVLTVYFLYAVSLSGTVRGLGTLFVPNWSSLLNVAVWSEAAQSSLFSSGLGTGGLIIFGGKTDLHYSLFRCAILSCFADVFASILSASVTFMVVWFLSQLLDLQFSAATLSGQGLVFVTFPDAVLRMGIPHLWAFALFLMLFCLAVDGSVAMTETISSGAGKLLCPSFAKGKWNVILSIMLLYLIGLICVTNGGPFIINILDEYGGGHSVMGTVMLQAIAFGWGYGVHQADEDIQRIQGSKPPIYAKICWAIVAPIGLLILFLYVVPKGRLTPQYDIEYPAYANIIGWTILIVVLIPVPIWMVVALVKYRKNFSRAFKPGGIWRRALRRRQSSTE